jgi:hypothetical protein
LPHSTARLHGSQRLSAHRRHAGHHLRARARGRCQSYESENASRSGADDRYGREAIAVGIWRPAHLAMHDLMQSRSATASRPTAVRGRGRCQQEPGPSGAGRRARLLFCIQGSGSERLCVASAPRHLDTTAVASSSARSTAARSSSRHVRHLLRRLADKAGVERAAFVRTRYVAPPRLMARHGTFKTSCAIRSAEPPWRLWADAYGAWTLSTSSRR